MNNEENKENKQIYKDIGSMCCKSIFLNEIPMRSAILLQEVVYNIKSAQADMMEEQQEQ